MFRCEIKTGGAAFRDPNTGEKDDLIERLQLAKILTELSIDIAEGKTSGSIIDINGNKVGSYSR